MKNIFLLPTDQPSRLYYHNDNVLRFITDNISFTTSRHIYIISDDEIKKGDWVLFVKYNTLHKAVHDNHFELNDGDCKKIILSTDQTLIDDGVQSIDDEFLEYFHSVNGEINYVIVEDYLKPMPTKKDHFQEMNDFMFESNNTHETFEEAAYQDEVDKDGVNECIMFDAMKIREGFELGAKIQEGFELGVKWQAENMYTEEETIQLLIKFNQEIQEVEDVRAWFEEFKKK